MYCVHMSFNLHTQLTLGRIRGPSGHAANISEVLFPITRGHIDLGRSAGGDGRVFVPTITVVFLACCIVLYLSHILCAGKKVFFVQATSHRQNVAFWLASRNLETHVLYIWVTGRPFQTYWSPRGLFEM